MEHKEPTWAKKVSPERIRKLYALDAQGVRDEALVDDVGVSLYARVDSILMVTSSNLGKAICVECRTEIPHNHDKAFVLVCPTCGWTMPYGAFSATYKRQTLNGYGALAELQAFARQYPQAKSYAEKMRLIDWLIHTFHGSMEVQPSRPTATNVIDGSNASVAHLIYSLAYGEGSTAAAEALDTWLEKFNRSIHRYIDPATGELKKAPAPAHDA